jgi:ADP-heptose:LPS heptosyltransferase
MIFLKNKVKYLYLAIVSGMSTLSIFIGRFIFHKDGVAKKRLLIIKLDHIGDYVLFRNFLQEIRRSERYRGYSITFCGNESVKIIAEWLDRDAVEEFLWINKEKIFKNPILLWKTFLKLHGRFAVALQPTYSRELLGDFFIKFSAAPERVGFDGDCNCISREDKKRSDAWYTRLVSVGSGSVFEFLKNKDFFQKLLGVRLNIVGPTIDQHFVAATISTAPSLTIQKKFAILFPGASLPLRRWPPKKFAALGDYVATRYGYQIVIAGAPFDASLALSIINYSSYKNFLDVTSRVNLPEMIGLFARAEVIISNDTSGAHFGAALGVDTIVLSQYNLYGRFVPYPREVVGNKMICVVPAKYPDLNKDDLIKKFAQGSDESMDLISVDQVKQAVDKILLNHHR